MCAIWAFEQQSGYGSNLKGPQQLLDSHPNRMYSFQFFADGVAHGCILQTNPWRAARMLYVATIWSVYIILLASDFEITLIHPHAKFAVWVLGTKCDQLCWQNLDWSFLSRRFSTPNPWFPDSLKATNPGCCSPPVCQQLPLNRFPARRGWLIHPIVCVIGWVSDLGHRLN